MRAGSGAQGSHSRTLLSMPCNSFWTLILGLFVWDDEIIPFLLSFSNFQKVSSGFIQDHGEGAGKFLHIQMSPFFTLVYTFFFLVFSLILLHAFWITMVISHFLLKKITHSFWSVPFPDTWVYKSFLGHVFFNSIHIEDKVCTTIYTF